MLRPSMLAGVLAGLPVLSQKEIDDAFEQSRMSDKFFLVRVNGDERGLVIFRRNGEYWEMHLCLATWFHHTRIAVRMAIRAIGCPIIAQFLARNRSVKRLLDDLGFEPPESFLGYYTDQMWHVRKLHSC